MSAQCEILVKAFPYQELPKITYGIAFPEACKKHVSETFLASKIYIISSSSLARNTDALKDLQRALGARVVGTRIGMQPHTLWSEVLEIVRDAREKETDLLITLGGGSLIDAAKVIAVALANNVVTHEDLMKLPHSLNLFPSGNIKAPAVPIISIPTSLSGGEFSNWAGATDDKDKLKYQFVGPIKGPALIILDGALATNTPLKFWLSSGIRAVDHCIETLCALESDSESDKAAERGLGKLIPGLLKTKMDPLDAGPRLDCQLGVADAMVFITRGVMLGASHGIGHMLGPMGVGHGETSCILLPAVCKYNAMHGANVERQKRVIQILWGNHVTKSVLEKRGLTEGRADLGDVLDAVIRELGLPRSLKDFSIGPHERDILADHSLQDKWVATNPVPLLSKAQVLEVLELCA